VNTFNQVLGWIVIAEENFRDGVNIIVTKQNDVVKLTKLQVLCMMSLALFGLFPKQQFFSTRTIGNIHVMLNNEQFARCFANYFIRTSKEAKKNSLWLDKTIIIERRYLLADKEPSWGKCDILMKGLQVIHEKKGVESIRNAFQVNFADPYPGGTIPSGHPDIVQEEILFLIYPELFVTTLIIPKIEARDAVVVHGVTRCNNYSGYKTSFKYDGDFTEDSNDIGIIFIDAVLGGIRGDQEFKRELNKALIGFSVDTKTLPIATGHWGCGAFGGIHKFKAVLQLMAAAVAGRDLIYATFGTADVNGFEEFYKTIIDMKVTVGELHKVMRNRYKDRDDLFSHLSEDLKRVREGKFKERKLLSSSA